MSTKIYDAYRCKSSVFDSFLIKIRNHCMSTTRKKIKSLASDVKTDCLYKIYYDKGWSEKMDFDAFCKEKEKSIRVREVLKLFVTISESKLRNPDDIDCSLNIWHLKNKFYIIPYGERWIYDKLKMPEGVEDYCYYNNTDHPENLTQRQWDARGKTWDKVCLDDWDSSRMVYKIIDVKESIGLTEVVTGLVPKEQIFMTTFNLKKENE